MQKPPQTCHIVCRSGQVVFVRECCLTATTHSTVGVYIIKIHYMVLLHILVKVYQRSSSSNLFQTQNRHTQKTRAAPTPWETETIGTYYKNDKSSAHL